MTIHINKLIDRFAALRVAALGEAMLDTYLVGRTRRLCQEAPVPVVALEQSTDAPGGAGNVAGNLAALGAQVEFLSVTGADRDGERLRASLEERGVGTAQLLAQAGRQTLQKSRVLAGSQMLVRFDEGDTSPIGAEMEDALIERLEDLYDQLDAVVISDYGYGILTPRVIRALGRLQAEHPTMVILDSKRLPAYRDVGVTAVKPNFTETLNLLGLSELCLEGNRAEALEQYGDKVLERTGAQIAAVTLDTEGALIFERGRSPYRTYARPAPHSRAAGAGDTFVASLALALAAGAGTPDAAELAAAATEIVTAKEGTASCFAGELRERFTLADKYFTDADKLAARVAFYREQGRRVVFTNGCFDILHRGHVTYLSRAKAQGDVLILGVNTDDGIRRLKGPQRPITTLEDRVQVLSALSCVDHIVAFDEDTPCELVGTIRPHLFVKGGDYTKDRLPEASVVEAYGGEVRILPFLADRSTTGIIERIRQTEEAFSRTEANSLLTPASPALGED